MLGSVMYHQSQKIYYSLFIYFNFNSRVLKLIIVKGEKRFEIKWIKK